MAIVFPGKGRISDFVISTVLGIDGRGIFPLLFWNPYAELIQAAHATGTTILGKSSTRYEHSGNFHIWNPLTWKFVQMFGEKGMINAYGLTNPGIEVTSNDIAESANQGIQIIPNIFPFFKDGWEAAAKQVCDSVDIFRKKMGRKFWAHEVSYSCPNTHECIVENVQDALRCTERAKNHAPDIIFIVKISVAHPPRFAFELSEAGADAIHSANSIPWDILFKSKSPLNKYGKGDGGVSGGPAFETAYRFNQEVLQHYSGKIIFGCGIVDDEKLHKYRQLASGWENVDAPSQASFSVCTAARRDPGWVKKQILSYNQE
jgi:dihydroorotate dehydrogenase